MQMITLSSAAARVLNSSRDFLERDMEIRKQESCPTIVQRLLSWMPIANLAITTSSITQRMWVSLKKSLEDLMKDSQAPLQLNQHIPHD